MSRSGRHRAVWLVALAVSAVACSSSSDATSSDATSTTGEPTAELSIAASTTLTTASATDDDSEPSVVSEPTTATPTEASLPAEDAQTTDESPPKDAVETVASATEGASSEPAPARDESSSGACVDDLTVRERAALLVWPAVYADDWAGAIETVRATDIGGVLLMGQGGLIADEIRRRLTDLEAASRHGLIVATDEEGGDVQRLPGLGILDSQRRMSQEATADIAADIIAEHGTRVRDAGVDMVLSPVIDVEPNVGEVPLQPSRLFAGGPDEVTTFAASYVDGWARAGLFPTLKHYPGHGAASGDTHISAGVTPSLDDLREFDLKPYRDLATVATGAGAAVMVGHLTVPGLTDGVPATQSRAAVDLLRDELGYADSLLLTDALGMAAVGLPEPEASVLALAAGIDVVLFTLTTQTGPVIDAIELAVGEGRIDAAHLDRAARKVMSMLERDGHTCNSNR